MDAGEVALGVVQTGLAAVLLVAGAAKLLARKEFRALLRLSRLPTVAAAAIALVVPVAELALGLGLLLARRSDLRLFMLATAALFAIFTIWIAAALARGLKLTCSCFGGYGTGSAVTRLTLVRTTSLGVASLIGFLLAGSSVSALPAASFGLVVAFSSCLLALLLLIELARVRPALLLTETELERDFLQTP